jgi:hypothetical protein
MMRSTAAKIIIEIHSCYDEINSSNHSEQKSYDKEQAAIIGSNSSHQKTT